MKKLIISILLVILLIGMTSCGNKTAEKDITTDFKNSIFVGDSITEGFAFNEILPEESVIAGAGATAGFTLDDIDDLLEKKPDKVFIMFGSIDILMPVDDPEELFRNDLRKLLNRIKEDQPDSKVYLQSITPVTEDALKEEPRYKELDEYNKIVKDVANKLSVQYVDLRPLVEKNPDLYAEDGIHFKKGFYLLWLEELSKLI